MSSFANRLTQRLEPYTPGEQPKEPGLIKLNTNENPFGPGPKVREAIASFPLEALRLYPDPESVQLRSKLAEEAGLSLEQVFVGNGSDEILAFIFQTFFEAKGEPLLFPEKTYSFYEVYAKRYGIPCLTLPLDADEQIDITAFDRPSQAVILANPNAPTGCLLTPPEIAELCAQNEERLVVVDEAYIDFAPEGMTALSLLARFANLLVVQTYSKSRSLAGLRIGMAYGSPELVNDLSKQKNCFNSYPLDRLAQTLARAALEEGGYYRHCCAVVRNTREEVAETLRGMGFFVTRSHANFLWIRHPEQTGEELYKALRSRRILVRHWQRPGFRDFLRVTVGSAEDMGIFQRALAEIIQYNGSVSEVER